VRQARVTLSVMLATAAEDGLVQMNAARGVRYVPTVRPSLEDEQAARERLRPLTRAEAAALLDAIPRDEDRLLVRFALSTGLRIGELIGLCWKHVDLGAHPKVLVREQVYAGKRAALKTSSAIRDVPLSPYLADALRVQRRDAYPGPDAPVFPSRAGTPRNQSAILGRIIKPAGRAIGLPWVHAHTMRRTAGSWLLQEGRTPVQVQRFLGHADAAFTMRSTYVGLVDEGVGDATLFDAALDGPRGVAVGTQKATHHPQDDAGGVGELAA
jgi:integrase